MNPQLDLLGTRVGKRREQRPFWPSSRTRGKVREKKKKKEKRLGYLGKKELIAEVRKIFPNATVLPNINYDTKHNND
jgi:hypothetical protein